jgi:hypothetical protein
VALVNPCGVAGGRQLAAPGAQRRSAQPGINDAQQPACRHAAGAAVMGVCLLRSTQVLKLRHYCALLRI